MHGTTRCTLIDDDQILLATIHTEQVAMWTFFLKIYVFFFSSYSIVDFCRSCM